MQGRHEEEVVPHEVGAFPLSSFYHSYHYPYHLALIFPRVPPAHPGDAEGDQVGDGGAGVEAGEPVVRDEGLSGNGM